jgi:hypothetical protein
MEKRDFLSSIFVPHLNDAGSGANARGHALYGGRSAIL